MTDEPIDLKSGSPTISNAPLCYGCQEPIVTIFEGRCTRCGWAWNPDPIAPPEAGAGR